MKKLLALSLVFLLLAPAVTFACECCDATRTDSSSGAQIRPHENCCPMLGLRGEDCVIERVAFSPRVTPQIFASQRFLAAQPFSTGEIANSLDLSEGFLFALPLKTPLYLAHQVLRI